MVIFGVSLAHQPPQTADKHSNDHLSIFWPDVQADIVDRTNTSGYLTRNGKRIIKKREMVPVLFAFIAIMVKNCLEY